MDLTQSMFVLLTSEGWVQLQHSCCHVLRRRRTMTEAGRGSHGAGKKTKS